MDHGIHDIPDIDSRWPTYGNHVTTATVADVVGYIWLLTMVFHQNVAVQENTAQPYLIFIFSTVLKSG